MVECLRCYRMTEQPVPSSHALERPHPSVSDPHGSGRRFGIRDGMFQAVAQGGGEHYLSAFAILLSATPFQLSILSAIPQLLGTWAQLISVKVSHWFPSQSSQVYWGIIGQSVSWIPILALPLLWPEHGPWLLIAGVAVYFTCTHFTSPAWNSLITELLDPNERGAYFAKRSRVVAITSLLVLCLAGALLSLFEKLNQLWIGFTIIFLTAGLCRSASALLLHTVTGFPQHDLSQAPTGFLHFLRTGVSHNFRHFLLFSGLMHAAVLIAGPFFVLYIIQDLHLAHWQYGTWLAAGILGQFLTLPGWGQFGDRFGNKALLTFTGLLVAFLPMLYLFSSAWLFLVSINFFGGVVWAGLGLGLNNYVYDAVQPADRAKAVAVSSMVNAVGWAMGTVAGSLLINTIPNRLYLGTFLLEPVSNIPFIFFLSGLLRLIVSATLLRTFHEPRQVEQRAHSRLLWELPLLKPLRQFSRRPTGLNQ